MKNEKNEKNLVDLTYTKDNFVIITQKSSPTLVNKIKSFGKGAKYQPDNKSWRVSIDHSESFLQFLKLHSQLFFFIITRENSNIEAEDTTQ